MIYLDNSATTREHDEVRALVNRLNDTCFGNASSLHEMGFMAHNEIEKARDEIKKYFSGDGEIIFTSGGTESDNMAIISSCSKMKKKPVKIITSRIEHPAVLNTCKRLLDLGYEVIMVDNDDKGLISTEDLSDKLDENVAKRTSSIEKSPSGPTNTVISSAEEGCSSCEIAVKKSARKISG